MGPLGDRGLPDRPRRGLGAHPVSRAGQLQLGPPALRIHAVDADLRELHQGLERSVHLRDLVGHAAVCGRQHAFWSRHCRKPRVALRAHRHARENLDLRGPADDARHAGHVASHGLDVAREPARGLHQQGPDGCAWPAIRAIQYLLAHRNDLRRGPAHGTHRISDAGSAVAQHGPVAGRGRGHVRRASARGAAQDHARAHAARASSR